jgi:hypothetical protein
MQTREGQFGSPGANTRKFTVSQNYFLIKDLQRPWITITRAYSAEKHGGTTIVAFFLERTEVTLESVR